MEARQAAEARQEVTALYHAHALGLVKLAVLMVGDQLTAEDVVQDAFLRLYHHGRDDDPGVAAKDASCHDVPKADDLQRVTTWRAGRWVARKRR
jgi:hypothetical protein